MASSTEHTGTSTTTNIDHSFLTEGTVADRIVDACANSLGATGREEGNSAREFHRSAFQYKNAHRRAPFSENLDA